MRRSLSARIAALAFVAFVTITPAFAAPRRNDSPMDGIERAFSRMIHHIVQALDLLDSQVIGPPK